MRAWVLVEHDDGSRRLTIVDDITDATVRIEAGQPDSVWIDGAVTSTSCYDPSPGEHAKMLPEVQYRRIEPAASEEPA